MVMIPGLLLAIALGWNPAKLITPANYYTNTNVFPVVGRVDVVEDGDTFTLKSGATVRLLWVNAQGPSFAKATAGKSVSR